MPSEVGSNDITILLILLICYGANIVVFCFPPSAFRNVIFFFGTTATLSILWQTNGIQGAFVVQTTSFIIPIIFYQLLGNIILQDPERTHRRTQNPPDFDITAQSVAEKFQWGLHHSLSWRGIGWQHQAKGILPPQGFEFSSKNAFVAFRVAKLAGTYLLLEFASSIIQSQSFWTEPVDVKGLDLVLAKARNAGLNMIVSYSLLTMNYTILSILGVVFCGWKPEDFPSLFGNISDAYTLRRFWGRTWHQLFRNFISDINSPILRFLHVPRGTYLSSKSTLYISFFLSGLLHIMTARGVRSAVPVPEEPWGFIGSRQLVFFMAQPVGIQVEDLILATCKRAGVGDKGLLHCVGYVWVLLWITYLAPFQGPMRTDGMGGRLVVASSGGVSLVPMS